MRVLLFGILFSLSVLTLSQSEYHRESYGFRGPVSKCILTEEDLDERFDSSHYFHTRGERPAIIPSNLFYFGQDGYIVYETAHQDGERWRTDYSYFAEDLPLEIRYTREDSLVMLHQFRYDSLFRVVTKIEAGYEYQYYDTSWREEIISYKYTDGAPDSLFLYMDSIGDVMNSMEQYHYYHRGMRVDSISDGWSKKQIHCYDSLTGRLLNFTMYSPYSLRKISCSDYWYDDKGRILQRVDTAFDYKTLSNVMVQTFVYDDKGSISQETWTDEQGTVYRTATSRFDNYGNLLEETIINSKNDQNKTEHFYRYDSYRNWISCISYFNGRPTTARWQWFEYY